MRAYASRWEYKYQRKSSPWENGYQESFYSHFKLELADVNRFEEYGELLEEIYRIMYYYNTKRIHTKLKMSPKEFKENFFKKRQMY